MTHYEERLEADLTTLRSLVAEVSDDVEKALENAVHAVLNLNRPLAYRTVLGDLPINRKVRNIDRLCHAFVARHLPSAGHLRYVSAVLRLAVSIERDRSESKPASATFERCPRKGSIARIRS